MPILEAFAANCPVICSDILVSREIASNAAIYFDGDSAEDLANCISNVSTISKMTMINASKRLCIFDWNKSSALHAELYSSLL